MMIKVEQLVFNPFMENTFVIYDKTGEGVIIDPGCCEPAEYEQLTKFIERKGLTITKLLNTHGHIDHVLGNDFVKRKYNVPLYLGRLEEPVYRAVKVYASNYGFSGYSEADVDNFLEAGDEVSFGKSVLDVIFVPGHSPGHLAFLNKAQKLCFSGDVLFRGSIGRTDLPGGDLKTLIESIHKRLFSLDPDYIVYNGHGPSTTIKQEMATNPFCAIPNQA